MKRLYVLMLSVCLASNIGISFGYIAEMAPSKEGYLSNWSLSRGCFNFMISLLRPGETLLELGSGTASGLLSKYVTVYSVEHDMQWVGQYDTHYIYAPISNGWYDTEILKKELPANYHLILVDGPTGLIGREGFLYNLALFNTEVPIIIDDVNRQEEHELLIQVAKTLGRKYAIYTSDSCNGNQFGIIFAQNRAE